MHISLNQLHIAPVGQQQQMIKANNKFRINHTSSKPALPPKPQQPTLSSLFSKAIQAVKEKAASAYSRLENKLTDTPAVFSVSKDERLKQHSVEQIPKERESSLSKYSETVKGRAKSNLTNEDGEKLKQLMSRKQQLMQRLRKIDYQLLNPPPPNIQLGLSRASASSPLKSFESRIKVQQSRVYNPDQHEKTIEMLSRLNNQKIKRQERIVQDMKRKQEQEIKRLNQIENKSHLAMNLRRNPTPLIKFNSRQTENLAFDRKTNSVAQSNHKFSEKIQNQFNELPQLITTQKPRTEQYQQEQLSI